MLRGLRAVDAPRMAELANDFDIARMTTRIPHPFAVEHAEDFIARMERSDGDREAVFAIESEGEGFLGVIGLHPGPAGAEIGYWLGRPFWGRGYATEAAAGVLAWVRADWGRRFIVSGHFADNPASGQVLCKTGFLYTGEVVGRFSVARGEEAPTRMMVWLA
jgi:RimJ/RimL family protein N-acetyltransferase